MGPALAERLTLLLNHVLASETVAVDRLRPHTGRVLGVRLQGVPSWLPAPPPLVWQVTPAGLLEWVGNSISVEAADLRVTAPAPGPADVLGALLQGQRPPLQVDGDAALAGDVSWLAENLRWDIGADLERLVGPIGAQGLEDLGRRAAAGLKGLVETAGRGLADLAGRARGG